MTHAADYWLSPLQYLNVMTWSQVTEKKKSIIIKNKNKIKPSYSRKVWGQGEQTRRKHTRDFSNKAPKCLTGMWARNSIKFKKRVQYHKRGALGSQAQNYVIHWYAHYQKPQLVGYGFTMCVVSSSSKPDPAMKAKVLVWGILIYFASGGSGLLGEMWWKSTEYRCSIWNPETIETILYRGRVYLGGLQGWST